MTTWYGKCDSASDTGCVHCFCSFGTDGVLFCCKCNEKAAVGITHEDVDEPD